MKQNRNRFSFILSLLLLVIPQDFILAQEKSITVNTDWDHERHAWNAWWISHPTAPVFDYGVFLFRKTVHLDVLPASSRIWVSADNRYRLWINGREVLSGPARGDFMNWRYEELDLAPYLVKGMNILAAEVFNLGKYRPVAQFSRQTAFLLDGEGALGDSIRTGKAWKVTQNRAYSPIRVEKETVRGFYVAGPTDRFDAANYPWGWQNAGFDDSEWILAEPVSVAAGRGYMHGIPWHLVPRTIPMMEQRSLRIEKIARFEGLQVPQQVPDGRQKWHIPARTKWTILLDQQFLTAGYPQLYFSGGKGSSLKITYAESLYDSLFRKGDRNRIDGKQIVGYYDLIYPDGSEARMFSPLWLRTWRYLQLEITTADEALCIDNLFSVFTAYPFVREATFNTEDIFIQSLWNTGWRTARLCALETYMDCPYYEQLQYLGDTRIQSLISLYLTGDDRLMKNAIRQADESRIPEGLTLGRAPSSIPQVTPPFSLYWVDMIHDFWMHRSDDAFVETVLPGIEAVLDWFERRIDSTGLPGPSDWFNFTDWTPGFQVGAPVAVDTGHSTLLALNYVYALQRASELFLAFGHVDKASHYSLLANRIKEVVRNRCYDYDRLLFSDTPGTKVFSQHTNIFAVLTGLADGKEKEAILNRILTDQDLIQTTVYFKFYLFEALRGTENAGKYLDMLGPWKEMLRLGLTTFREDDYEDRSDCHAWSASPLYHLLSLVAGIRPGSKGFSSVIIEPAPGSLPVLGVSMPHPKGKIGMELSFGEKHTVKGTVTLPPGTSGEFRWNGKTIELHEGIQKINIP
ncbi:MAG: hypothetical protein U0T82_11330 [Bacteroidales bacterium]